MERLIEHTAQGNRHDFRDCAMVLLAYGHGLRVSELVSATWWDEKAPPTRTLVNLKDGWIWVKRAKNSRSMQQDLSPREKAALRQMVKAMKRARPDYEQVGPVFRSERGNGAITGSAFHKIVARAGRDAGLGDRVHPHQLRHACGYKLLNKDEKDIVLVQRWLGHKNIRHTQRYTEIDEKRMKGFWKD